ncbi:SusD/RagB family nutrient-binding outer membrane lipoprotein [Rapidithrix thailandica]|uniref:SusD/RagB family nutrient-binding outer membrane lipoprotein n=1 Tax=Rapidithrix thailandica TaxID=413964 RepID=A0AAW9S783_9BACT
MKKILILAFAALGLVACDDRMEKLNKPTKNPLEVPASTLYAQGVREAFDMMVNTNVNENVWRLFAQYWAQTTYPDESQYNLVGRTIPATVWQNGYRDALSDLVEGRRLVVAEMESGTSSIPEEVLKNQIALLDIMSAYVYSVLVDTFGDIPFEETFDTENVTPKYDDAAATYDNIVVMLDEAVASIDFDAEGFANTQDPVYEGSLENWAKFAATLKMRLGMRLADVDAAKSQKWVNEALAAGIFESNADNASITYFSVAPNTNPLYEDLVLSGRADFIVSNTLVDLLNDLQDPRMMTYAANPISFKFREENEVKQDSLIEDGVGRFVLYEDADGNDYLEYKETPFVMPASDAGKNPRLYVGGVYGSANSYKVYSHIGDVYYVPELKGTIINYAETQFLLAEAAERGGYNTTMSAEEYYNTGIKASFDQWDVEGVNDYLALDHIAYTTAPGDWKQKIGTQMWLALYNQGFEGWTTWRRLDMDLMNTPAGMDFEDIPVRFTYPLNEGQLNGQNYHSAGEKIGGDKVSTKLFWDAN